MNSPPLYHAPANSTANDVERLSVPVIEEELAVDTVHEHTGTVRVRKVVRDIQQAVPSHGYREQVEIERKPINRPVEAAQPVRQETGVLIVPVYEERMVKQLFLVEEIHVMRHREPADEAAGEAVVHLRREEVVIERFDTATQQWLADPA